MHNLHIQIIQKNNNFFYIATESLQCHTKLHFTIRGFLGLSKVNRCVKQDVFTSLQIRSVLTVKCRHSRLSTGAPQQTTSNTHCLLSHSPRVTSCLGSLRFLGRQSTTDPRRESGRGVDLGGVFGGFPTSAPNAGESSLLPSLSIRCKTMADIAIAAAAIKNKTHMKKVCRPQLFCVAILIIHRRG